MIPSSTYRIQFSSATTLQQGADLVPYLDALGVGAVYASPLLEAGTGSNHGYDVVGEMGPDALDPALTLEAWRERIRKHPGELKNLLRNQSFVAGIGNAYSDEILWAARLQPFRKRSSLAAEEVDDLYAAMRSTLPERDRAAPARVPPTFEKQVRDHLAVHNRGGEACPRCGTKITAVKAGASRPGSAGAASADRGAVRLCAGAVAGRTPAPVREPDDQHLADLERARIRDVVGRLELLHRRGVALRDAAQRVARLDLVRLRLGRGLGGWLGRVRRR